MKKSPLKRRRTTKIVPTTFEKITIKGGESKKIKYEFDKIYSAYTYISIKCNAEICAKITTEEIDGITVITEEIKTNKSIVHRSQRMFSVGQITLEITNNSTTACEIDDLAIEYIRYPIKNNAYFKCSNLTSEINQCNTSSKRIKDKNHTNVAIDAEKVFDKILTFVIKTLNKLEIEGKFLNLINGI